MSLLLGGRWLLLSRVEPGVLHPRTPAGCFQHNEGGRERGGAASATFIVLEISRGSGGWPPVPSCVSAAGAAFLSVPQGCFAQAVGEQVEAEDEGHQRDGGHDGR